MRNWKFIGVLSARQPQIPWCKSTRLSVSTVQIKWTIPETKFPFWQKRPNYFRVNHSILHSCYYLGSFWYYGINTRELIIYLLALGRSTYHSDNSGVSLCKLIWSNQNRDHVVKNLTQHLCWLTAGRACPQWSTYQWLIARLSLQWRHNEWHSVSNHQRVDCLLSCLFRCTSQNTSKLCVTGLWEWNPPVTGGFPSQRPSNMENASIWWCHHIISVFR